VRRRAGSLSDGGSGVTAAGRGCPASYGYSPAVFARPPDLSADIVYVIGGLYGNPAALREIERMAAHEASRVALVFNGDFHWFDADPEAFRTIGEAVMRHTALRGNVETEIASDDDAYGCGCAYPEDVPDADVERSNAILARLKQVARGLPDMRARLARLPMHRVASIGSARIAIVHGDAWSLAGWRFDARALHDAANEHAIADAFERAAVDGFASSHTCLPALKVLATDLGERFVINNGAAGMANFSGTRHGVISRLAAEPVPQSLASHRLYGADCGSLAVDALAVHFDSAHWTAEFARLWPPGSAAHTSYAHRIARGPNYSVDQALGRVAAADCAALDA
jgi:hypothetical protein